MLKRLSEQLSSVMHRGAQFLRSKYMRRTLTAFSIVSILVGIFVFAAPTYAEGMLEEVANGIINGVSYILIAVAGIFVQLTIFALKFFIEIAGYNNFIDADIVQLGWNMVRDVANMFFVVVLLVIAFGTILGLEQYEWKKTLIKLVMAAFFVNFSNLICQLIIDVSQVFTITFLNAVAGAAGGNLIKMFNFDEILNISTRNTDPTGIQIEFFAGAVMTVTFAGIAMATMGAYLIVIIARMVVLWTLMILSPLAFLFSALPNTQSYAQEFWNEFVHHVIVAPVMVFFLWLAFATFGGGNIVQSNIEANHPMIIDGGINRVTDATDAAGNVLGVTISAAASWENMANFAVAIAFLWIGLERVQKLGVVGGGIVSGAMAFGKNVATIGSGLALGRWLGSGAKGLASQGTKAAFGGLYAATLANPVERTGNWLKRNTVEGWRNFRSRGPMPEMEAKKVGAEGGINQANVNNQTGEGYDNAGNKVKKDENGKWMQVEDNGSWKYERGDDGEIRYDFKRDKEGKVQFEKEDSRGLIQKAFYNRHEALLKSRKLLEKVQKQTAVREELMDKRVTANPKHIFQGLEGNTPDALDRMEQGMLEAEKMRSAAKTEEFQALGKQMVLDSARFKDGKFQTDKPTLAGQIAAHKENAKLSESLVQRTQERARRDYLKDAKGQKVVQGRIQAELQVKQAQASSSKMEGLATSSVMSKSLADLKKFDEEKAAAVARGVMTKEEAEKYSDKNRADLSFLADTISAEKQAHSESIRQERLQKNLERKYAETEHGTQELKEESEMKLRMLEDVTAIKELEARADQQANEKLGDVIARINFSEMGIKAADEFVKGLKETDLSKAFEEASVTLEAIMDQANGDPALVEAEINKLAIADNYIAALRQGERMKEIAKERKVTETRAVDSAHDAVTGLNQGGRTGSTVMGELGEAEQSSYRIYERTQGMKMAADRMAHLAMKRKMGGGKLNISDQVALKGAMDFIDSESWNDDIADHVFGEIAALEVGEIDATSERGRKAQTLKDFFHGEMGWKGAKDPETGKYKIESTYGADMSSDLQIFASLGGDVEALRAHRNIEAKEKGMYDAAKNRAQVKLNRSLPARQAAAQKKALDMVDVDGIGKQITEKEALEIAKSVVGDTLHASIINALPKDKKSDPEAYLTQLSTQDPAQHATVTAQIQAKVQQAVNKEVQDIVAQMMNEQEEVAISFQQKGIPSYEKIFDSMSDADLGMSKDKYVEVLKSNQDFMQTSARIYKQHALANGHLESHSIAFDGGFRSGMLRPMTVREARADVVGEAVKRDPNALTRMQFHSLGQLDLNSHLLDSVDETMYRTMYGNIAHEYEIKNMPLRTLQRLFCYGTGENVRKMQGHLLLGGAKLDSTHRRGTVERGDHIIKDILLPQILGNARAFMFSLKRMGNHVKAQEMSRGVIKLDIDGVGKVRDFAQLAQIARKRQAEMGISDNDLFRLEQIAAEFKKGVELGGSRGGRIDD